jgi:DNA polymerase elongation subunit (family B)
MDLITGWNSHGFDWPYLLERAKRLQTTDFPYLDRLLCKGRNVQLLLQKPTFAGRVAFDAMHYRADIQGACGPQ